MIVKKINLRKFGLLAILSVGMLSMSCEKEDIEIEDAEAVEEITVSKPITIDYKYNYNGQIFTEKQWEKQSNQVGSPNYSIIGLNEMLYVFDDEFEAQSFQDGELQVMMDAIEETPSLNAKATLLSSGVVKFRLDLFKDKDYKGQVFTLNRVETVRRMANNWGQPYLENNEWEANLPSFIDEETTSYKLKLIQNTSLLSNGVTLRMYTKLRLGTLSEGGAEWEKLLVYNNTTEQDSDFSNNRIWGAFGLVNWNDRIRSWNVEFR